MVNLILTDSYFNLFPILTEELSLDSKSIDKKKLVFCESKVSLMIERQICDKFGGTFNTDVYSFGKFLSANKKFNKVLSKEGSAMAIKRILTKINLSCFKQSKENLAPALYDLIIQLKSAKITPEELLIAKESTRGVLKNKLNDINLIFSTYENYIKENGFEDQSSLLDYLPSVIENSKNVQESDVFIVGFSSFTAQMRSAIKSLISTARSVTAILVEGDNPFVFVNETADFIRSVCKENSFNLLEKKVEGDYSLSGKIISKYLFNPETNGKIEKKADDFVYFYSAKNPKDEIERIAEIIKSSVIEEGLKYKDFTIATSNIGEYEDQIKEAFSALDIPYFIDKPIFPLNHPLVVLIINYIDLFRKGFERETLLSFIKNPLFCQDKVLLDNFENYVKKYNVNYKGIFSSFTFPCEDFDLEKLENFRESISLILKDFNLKNMLLELKVKEKIENLSSLLKEKGEDFESAVTEQIYEKIDKLLKEMDTVLQGVTISLTELKNILTSGFSAMQLSIIPQYNDAVFIGDFKESALAKAKRLFAIGLTSSVPNVQADVSLLLDEDISVLENIKVLVEPKIRVVNKRIRENVTAGLSAFSERLYLSYPICSLDGKTNLKSEVLEDIFKLFTVNEFPNQNGYLTKKQGLKSFALECGYFARGSRTANFNYDFTVPSSYFNAVDDKEYLNELIVNSKVQVKERLNDKNPSLIKEVISPTTIEDYHGCPYKAFVSRTLKIKERDEGDVTVLMVGNLMHEILNLYVKKINLVKDENSSNSVFDDVSKKILEKDDYKKLLSDARSFASVERILGECKEYAYKTFLSISQSKFSKSKTEVGFGDGKEGSYKGISLLDGKVKLKGKIDRVDENEKFFRVLDYKTGKIKSMDKSLFAGVKLQLYLYAKAVMQEYGIKKMPAGLYYLPISEKYQKEEDKVSTLTVGKTLNDLEALSVQDETIVTEKKARFIDVGFDKRNGKLTNVLDDKAILNRIDYALKVCETAVKRMMEGVIIPSPFEKECEHCDYSALCGQYHPKSRELARVDNVFTEKTEDILDE